MKTAKSGSKKNSEAMRELREKKDAEAKKKAGKVKGKKSPAPAKPAKPAKDKPAKVAKKSEPQLITGGQLITLKEDANRIIPQLREQISSTVKEMGNLFAMKHLALEIAQKELWKYCETPYKSETAWVQDMKSLGGPSASTIFALLGWRKLLPGKTADELVDASPRKVAIAKRMVKQAKAQGKEAPATVIDAAADKTVTEEQYASQVRDAGYDPEPERPAPVDDRQTVIPGTEDLMANTQVNTLPYNPRIGGSGTIEGQEGTAQQFSAVVIESLDIVREVYGRDDLTDMEAIEFALKEFRNGTCTAPGYEDRFNHQALDAVRREKKSKKASAK